MDLLCLRDHKQECGYGYLCAIQELQNGRYFLNHLSSALSSSLFYQILPKEDKGIVSRDGVLTEATCIGLISGKSRGKHLWRNKERNCRCKMAGTGIQLLLAFRPPISAECHKPRDRLKPLAFRAQTYCGMPTTTRQLTAEGQLLSKIWPRNATDWTFPLLNFPRNATNCVPVLSPWHSAVHIWARNLAKDWIPAPTILHREPPCLLRHIFLTLDFPGVSRIRGELFRSKLYTKGLSWHSISWHYPFKEIVTIV
jgi:hypothetical protein